MTQEQTFTGTTKRFETLSQTFVATELGTFNAHHYRYSPTMSTFLVECDRATWARYGFDDKSIDESKAICERVFTATLDGHPLVSNRSVWRNFPWLWNEHWRKLLRSQRTGIEEGLPTQHQSLHQRGERNEVLPAHDCGRRTKPCRRGAAALG